MSLAIHTPTTSVTWYLGDDLFFFTALSNKEITVVIADGDELEYIKERFDNLPMANHRKQVRWYGDDAKFIVRNFREDK